MTYNQGIAMCNAILAKSETPDGMVITWLGECLRRRATQVMLRKIKQRYEELNK